MFLLRPFNKLCPQSGLWFLAMVFAGVLPASAQTTSGTLIGQVLDTKGGPLLGAKVTVINDFNGNTKATLTDANGTYTVAFLTPGTYKITASLGGYTDGSVDGFIIPLNATTPLTPPRITLAPVGAASTGTTGSTATPASAGEELTTLTDTTDPARRANFDLRLLESLPLGGATDVRTFDELAFLAPGVAPPPYTPGVRGPGVGYGVGTAGEFSVNGMRSRSNNFTVDGSDNNDPDVGVRRQGFVSLVPQSIESVQELEISTLLWNSELGRNFGSQVNAVSKGGGSSVRGQAYGFFTDSRLNARNFFDYTGGQFGGKTPYTRTQAGFVLGGPLGERTQLFGSFEEQIINGSTEQHFASPTASDRDFRQFLGSVLGREPASFGVMPPFSGAPANEGFQTGLGQTPLGSEVLSFYPLPNDPGGPFGANTFTQVLPSGGRGSVFSLKSTTKISEANSLAARYNFTDDSRTLPSVNNAISSTITAGTRTQDLSLILDSTFRPTIFNQARFSYGRTNLKFAIPSSEALFQASQTVQIGGGLFPSTTGPIGELLVQPYSPVGVDTTTFPQGRVDNTFQYADSVAWKKGAHAFRFGADIRRLQLNSFQDRNYRPTIVYGDGQLRVGNQELLGPISSQFVTTKTVVLPGVATAALGVPTSIFQTVTDGTPNSEIGLRLTEYDFFFNDNWRVNPRFALDYGLRYEHDSVPTEVNHLIANALALKNLPQPGSSSFDTRQFDAAYEAAVSAYKQVLGGRTAIYRSGNKNFGPHLGFAWSVDPRGMTVVRAGYGIYFDTTLGAVVSQSRDVFPNEIPVDTGFGFLGFDVLNLANPSSLKMNGVPLLKPGTLNQLNGSPQDFPALLGSVIAQEQNLGGIAFTLPEKNLRTPYSQQWHLTLEHEFAKEFLVTMAYVGTKGTGLTRIVTPNLGPNLTLSIPLEVGVGTPGNIQPAPFPTVLGDCPTSIHPLEDCPHNIRAARPIPVLGSYTLFENSGSSSYHSLQLEARKRFSAGYTFTAAYTWSHSIDDVSDVFPISGAPIVAEDQNDLNLEKASSNFDVRQRLALSLVWDLPFYRDRKGGNAFWLGGWQLDAIVQANTGQPFTLGLPIDANFDGNFSDRPSTTNGLIFFSGHGPNKVAMAPGQTLTNFFVLGQDGAVGRNTVRADAFVDGDFALAKTFRIKESQALDFRAEFFNLANRANFGIPVRIIGASGFGSAIDTVSPARTIQFALKYKF